ncbi:hypothetical protein SAMN03159338_3590 [Sphingomonas sp. NFR04]|uniref:hypothetical protein n=1 Tax=Sphingomonas sp. NFR04 TaxID=1566283 RepID=UPI0008EB9E12|nr:hypothetical protein [Sphingomonas sp. NFR04]SFK22540.1 hypothetical protein SAMN03159338_3590 [Sphingomonas sp. NFR04]
MVGSILGGAFRLLRRHPLSVLVWAILYLVGIFAIGLLRILIAPADPESVVGAIGAGLLSQGLVLALVAVLITAATRATLHPYKRGACYLRLGANELRVFALLMLLTIATMVATFLLTLANGLLLGLLGWLVPAAATGWIGVALLLAEMAGLIFVQVRLSIALPLTYLYETITVDEAWAQSRGHFWSIFGAFAALAILLALAGLALLAAFFLPILGTLVQTGANAQAVMEMVLMLVLAAKNLPAAAQVLLVSGMLALVALGFVLMTATLASAARTMLGLQDGQIEDLRRSRG